MLENFDLPATVTREGKTLPGLQWNWKVMMENFNDPYHASRLHGPLQTFAPSHLNDFLPWDPDDGAVGRIQYFTDIDGSFNPTKKLPPAGLQQPHHRAAQAGRVRAHPTNARTRHRSR